MNLSQPIKILIALIFVTVVLTFDQLTILTSTEPKHIEEPKVAKVVDPKQLTCMAKNIFYEAGSESLMGKRQ